MSFISSEEVYEGAGDGLASGDGALTVANKYTEELYGHVAASEGLKVSTIMQWINQEVMHMQAGVDLVRLELLLDPENGDPLIKKETFRDLFAKWLNSFVNEDDGNMEETRSESAMSSRSAFRLPEVQDCDDDYNLIDTKQKLVYVMKENEGLKLKLEMSQMSCEKQDSVVSNLIEKAERQQLFNSQQSEEHERVQRDLTCELQKEKSRSLHLERQMQRNCIADKESVDELLETISSNKEQYQVKLEGYLTEKNKLNELLNKQYINVSMLEKDLETLQHKLLNYDKLEQELRNQIYELEKSNTLLKYEKKELKEQIATISNRLLEIENQAMLSNFVPVNKYNDSNNFEERSSENFIIPPPSSTPKKRQSLFTEMFVADQLELSSIAVENAFKNCHPSHQEESIQVSTRQQGAYHTAECGTGATSTVSPEMPNVLAKLPQSFRTTGMLTQKTSDLNDVNTSQTGRPQNALTLENAKRTLFCKAKRSLHSTSLPTVITCHVNETEILQCRSLSQSDLTDEANKPVYNSVAQADGSSYTDVYLSLNETYASHNTSSSGRGSVGTGTINSATFCVNPDLSDAIHGCEDIGPEVSNYDHDCLTIDNKIIINKVENEVASCVSTDSVSMIDAKPQISAPSTPTAIDIPTLGCVNHVLIQSETVVSEGSSGIKATSDKECKSSRIDMSTNDISTQCDIVLETGEIVELGLCVQWTQTDVSVTHISTQCDVDISDLRDHVKVDLVTQHTQTEFCSGNISPQYNIVVSDVCDHVNVDLRTQATQTDICENHIFTQCDIVMSGVPDHATVDSCLQLVPTDKCALVVSRHTLTECEVITTGWSKSDVGNHASTESSTLSSQIDEFVFNRICESSQCENVLFDAGSQVVINKCAIFKEASTQFETSVSDIGTQVTLDVNTQLTQSVSSVNLPVFNISTYYPNTPRQSISSVLCQRFIQLFVFIFIFLLIAVLVILLGVMHVDWDTVEYILLELGATYEGPIIV